MAIATPDQPDTGLLRSVFGFPEFRPGQAEAIGCLNSGENAVVVMPTGAGKSLIYQFVAVARAGTALVISPLISLMQDQVESLARRKVPSAFINSSIPAAEQARRMQAMADGEYRLVYVAPERLRNSSFRQALGQMKLSLLAIDEAHCVSQWGHDFRPDYLHIAEARKLMGNPLTAALTATATPRVRSDIASLLGLDPVRHIVTGFNRPNLAFEVQYASDAPGKMRALLALLRERVDGGVIVYTGTRRDAEEVADLVSQSLGVGARFYHAGMPSESRAAVQDQFMSRKLPVVVATNAFGMGIDRADVRLVVHYTMPGSLEEYYQEAGRAGRDGEPARAVLVYAPPDRALQEFFIDSSRLRVEDLRDLHVALQSKAGRPRWFTNEDISCASGLHEVAVKVALAQLEAAEAITISAVEGPRTFLLAGEWKAGSVRAVVERSNAHLGNKREQLEQMVGYAESNSCRRVIILNHFGDVDPPQSPLRKGGSEVGSPPYEGGVGGGPQVARCCDNCLVRQATSQRQDAPTDLSELTRENKTALLIIDAVRRMPWEVGVGKLARILSGSKAKDIEEFDYNKIRCYGKLSVFSRDEVKSLIEQVVTRGYLKTVGGRLPVLRLTNLGTAALETRERIGLVFPRQVMKHEVVRAQKKKRQVGDSIEATALMFEQGKSPAEIAQERGFVQSTIYMHFSQLIADGRIVLDGVIPERTVALIRKAVSEVEDTAHLWPIKERLPESVTYGEIRCVLAAD